MKLPEHPQEPLGGDLRVSHSAKSASACEPGPLRRRRGVDPEAVHRNLVSGELAGQVHRQPLDADLGDAVGGGGDGDRERRRATSDETLRMRPSPAAREVGDGEAGGHERRVQVDRQDAVVHVERDLEPADAARRPRAFTGCRAGRARFTVVSTIAATSVRSARSTGTPIARPPSARIPSTVSSRVPGVGCGSARVDRAAHATAYPSRRAPEPNTAPIPRLAPVTRATFCAATVPSLRGVLGGLGMGDDRGRAEAPGVSVYTQEGTGAPRHGDEEDAW